MLLALNLILANRADGMYVSRACQPQYSLVGFMIIVLSIRADLSS